MSHTRRRTSGWLDFTSGVELMTHTHSRQIPLAYSLLSAGPAVEMCDDGYALLDINALICNNRRILAFIVTGDSMRDDIRPGYIVFLDPDREPRNGDTVAVNLNGQNCIKIFEKTERKLCLVPKNGDYPTQEVKPADNLHIIGVVTSHLAVY